MNILPGYSEENIIINSAPNSKLRWEKTASYNLGIDFSVLNQAINLSVDYYYRKGTDLIGSKALALENGFTNMSINWASMENKGVEINLQTCLLYTSLSNNQVSASESVRHSCHKHGSTKNNSSFHKYMIHF